MELTDDSAEAIRVSLGREGPRQFFGWSGDVKTRAAMAIYERKLSLGPLPPERYLVNVWVEGSFAYLPEMSVRGQELKSPIIDFSQPGSWTDLRLRIRFDPALGKFRIAIASGDSRNARDARVIVAPAAADSFGRLRCRVLRIRRKLLSLAIAAGTIPSSRGPEGPQRGAKVSRPCELGKSRDLDRDAKLRSW